MIYKKAISILSQYFVQHKESLTNTEVKAIETILAGPCGSCPGLGLMASHGMEYIEEEE